MMKVLGVTGEVVDHLTSAPLRRSVSEGPPSPRDNTEVKISKKIVFPPSYPFGDEDSEKNIVLDYPSKTAPPLIRSATLHKLIEKLTEADSYLPVQEFILMCNTLADITKILDLLILRFKMPIPQDIDSDPTERDIFVKQRMRPVQLKVVNVLRKWISKHWARDFDKNQQAKDKLQEFITEQLAQQHGEISRAFSTLNKIFAKSTKHEKLNNDWNTVIAPSAVAPPPESYQVDVKLLSTYDSRMTFMAFHPQEIARQLCLIEHEIFREIADDECLGQNWTKKERQHKAPNIVQMIQRFNKVSMWVTSTLVQLDNFKARVDALTRFIEIAEYIREYNNYNGLMEILAGLRSASIHRLKKTWAKIEPAKIKSFEEMLDLMTPDGNYSKIRTHLLWSVTPPCLPYLGVFLTDLTFLEDGNPDNYNDGLINYDKRRRISQVVKTLSNYKSQVYSFHTVPIIKGFLLAGGEYVDENKCYKLSLEIEPRDGKVKIKDKGKSWKILSPSKKKESIQKRSLLNLYVTEERKSKIQASDEVDLSELADMILGGQSRRVEQLITKMDKTDAEKNKLRDDIKKLCLEKAKTRTFSVSEEEEEAKEIPFDSLVESLLAGDAQRLEKYLEEEAFDAYEAERIRIQTYKLLEEKRNAK
eukprot:TRINITY_DN3730_c0_g1_i1.p1 TRINITY_DN3730_c0_g1~~TRINITY_DN3730_c0_g1_i1.p1  ORF type:complete len:644 (-),score=209.08 TRINITY_DN3730_c0_g1_i1:151-2082(-)